MRIRREHVLLSRGPAQRNPEVIRALSDIRSGIRAVVWPPGRRSFSIRPELMGNGVTPIKEACVTILKQKGWQPEVRLALAREAHPGPIDAVKKLSNGRLFAFEWETGNVSSSHRALNKMLVGLQEKILIGGALILPTRALYRYLTDRVGNYEELAPYFSVWDRPDVSGFLAVIAVEFDKTDFRAPTCLLRGLRRIAKKGLKNLSECSTAGPRTKSSYHPQHSSGRTSTQSVKV